MAKPEDALNLALARFQRSPLRPTAFATTSLEPAAITVDTLRNATVTADRFTCRVDAGRINRFRTATLKRGILVSLIDGEPGASLQLQWALAHVELLGHVAETLSDAWDAKVRFIVPDDLPGEARARLKPLRSRAIAAKYPAGHHRLLPRASGVFKSPLVLDAVAMTDLAHAAATGQPPRDRPVLVDSGDDRAYRIVERGSAVSSLAELDDALTWYAGPRLTDRLIDPATPIDDGELTFYREPRGSRFASPCIRCGGCVEVCPTRCDPVALLELQTASVLKKNRARAAGLNSCIDCGLCTAVCPSMIELHHLIAALKRRAAEATP